MGICEREVKAAAETLRTLQAEFDLRDAQAIAARQAQREAAQALEAAKSALSEACEKMVSAMTGLSVEERARSPLAY